MTLDDIARQLVITVRGTTCNLGWSACSRSSAHYSPELVTDWEIKDEKGEVLLSLQRFEVLPPREVIDRREGET